MNEPRKVCCYMCHRYRDPEKMDGTRCIDREACRAYTAKAAPVRVPKRILRKQFGSGGIE